MSKLTPGWQQASVLESVFDQLSDALILYDPEFRVTGVNRAAEKLFGMSSEEIRGKPLDLLLPERYRAGHGQQMRRFGATGTTSRRMGDNTILYALRKDGTEFPVEISLSPVEDGDRVLTAAAIRDVTDRKRVEAELIVARESAERARAAADRQRQIADEAREIADRANQGKSRFLATASHDLRQPLQTLRFLQGTLQQHYPEGAERELVADMAHSLDTMCSMLSSLLDIM